MKRYQDKRVNMKRKVYPHN